MGGNSSKSEVQKTTDIVYNTTNTFLSENSTKVAAKNKNVNTISFKGSTLIGCPIKTSQKIDATTAATGFIDSAKQQELASKIATDLNSAIDQSAASSSGTFALSQGNSAENITNLKTSITKNVTNTMQSKNVQDIFAEADNQNMADFSEMTIDCRGSETLPGIEIDQNIRSHVTAQALTQEIVKSIVKDEAATTVTDKVAQKAETHSAGLDDLVKAATGPYAMSCSAIIACVILALLFLPMLMR